MIRKFDKQIDYSLAGYPTSESRVSLIAENGEVAIDGVNVLLKHPDVGDAVYKKDGEKFYFKGGDALNHEMLVAQGFEGLGQTIGMRDGKIIYLDREIGYNQMYRVAYYAITDITTTSIQLTLRLSGYSSTSTTIDIELEDTQISAANAEIISNAVDAAASALGINDWWAYLDGDEIIVQRDSYNGAYLNNVSAVGCECVLKIPSHSELMITLMNNSGTVGFGYTFLGSILNRERAAIYYTTNGRAAADEGDVWHANKWVPLQKAAFLSSILYGEGEHQYPTYEDYLWGEFGVAFPQSFASFLSKQDVCQELQNIVVPTKDGGTAYVFPFMHFAASIDRGVKGLSQNDLFLADMNGLYRAFEDSNLSKINATRRKMGHTPINTANAFMTSSQGYGRAFLYTTNGSVIGHSFGYPPSAANKFYNLAIALLDE